MESKFDKFGPVREARIVRNPVNGESRGFGFVAMKYEEDVDAVSAITSAAGNYRQYHTLILAVKGVHARPLLLTVL